MADITPKPIILNDITLTIGGANDYAATVSRAVLTPTVPTAKWKGMRKGSDINLVGEPDWVLDLNFAQDHETAASLSTYLLANIGQVKEVNFAPVRGGKGYKINVVMVPGAIGGDLGSADAATSSVQLPCNGQPTVVA
ncbi:hypothetical protein ACIGEP_15530 [Microbacterium sp. NPDC077663]|uniref:hypothetical protein n=1 Tax=Microbacterium sp. NPDC077663 TaxID=3364189 RepID=UPI0037C7D4C8